MLPKRLHVAFATCILLLISVIASGCSMAPNATSKSTKSPEEAVAYLTQRYGGGAYTVLESSNRTAPDVEAYSIFTIREQQTNLEFGVTYQAGEFRDTFIPRLALRDLKQSVKQIASSEFGLGTEIKWSFMGDTGIDDSSWKLSSPKDQLLVLNESSTSLMMFIFILVPDEYFRDDILLHEKMTNVGEKLQKASISVSENYVVPKSEADFKKIDDQNPGRIEPVHAEWNSNNTSISIVDSRGEQ